MSDIDDYATPDEYMDELEEEWEDPCSNCGPHCPDWGGDGICMLEIEAQTKMRKEYEEKHIRKSKCPVCGKELTEYDVFASGEAEPWVWNAGWYYPILGIEVLGALWLNKGIIHSKERVFHVWIEWGTGKEERLLKYLTKEEAEKDMVE